MPILDHPLAGQDYVTLRSAALASQGPASHETHQDTEPIEPDRPLTEREKNIHQMLRDNFCASCKHRAETVTEALDAARSVSPAGPPTPSSEK